MKKVFVIEPEFPGVEGYDFKVDIEFKTRKEAEKYAKDNELGKGHYIIDNIIPHSKLFFADIMARIPYGVKFRFQLDKDKYKTVSLSDSKTPSLDHLYSYWMRRGYYLPYLRPMSSMTKEEKNEYRHMLGATLNSEGESIMFVYEEDFSLVIDWLNAHHFDYRGLIDKGLALEASKNMYKI